jgi:hypothetical protein
LTKGEIQFQFAAALWIGYEGNVDVNYAVQGIDRIDLTAQIGYSRLDADCGIGIILCRQAGREETEGEAGEKEQNLVLRSQNIMIATSILRPDLHELSSGMFYLRLRWARSWSLLQTAHLDRAP